MTLEEIKRQAVTMRDSGETWTDIAIWIEKTHGLSVHRTTVQRWYDREVIQPIEEEETLLDNESRVKLDKKLAGSKSEAKLYKKLYEQTIKELAKKDLLISSVQELAPSFNPLPQVAPAKPKSNHRGSTPQVVVAPLTDTHIGEYVDLQQMAGLNQYDFEIFNNRLHGWATQLLNLVSYRRNSADINELVVPLLGDMISGDIHEELSKTNIDHCMGQMIRGANLIAQSLRFLAPHFESIKVPCVVGNHGRMTRKPPMKDKYMDWDYLMYQWIAAFCRNHSNIHFEISQSFFHVFNVVDRNILIMHGDAVSGGGSAQSLTKTISNLRSVLQYNQEGFEKTQFDSVMLGHFHRVDEIDIDTGELHICGCMKGPDEFAFQRIQKASHPKQIVTYWHPAHGYIGKEVIYLSRYDDTESEFVDLLPDTWANILERDWDGVK